MYIDCVTNNGKPYLRVAESYTTRVDGVRKTRKRTIMNIGPMARYDDGEPGYLARLKKSFLDGHPIIEGLDHLLKKKQAGRKVTIEFDRDNEESSMSCPKNIGYFLLDGLYDGLGIYDVLNKHKSQSRIEHDLNGLEAAGTGADTWPIQNGDIPRQGPFALTTGPGNLIHAYRALDVLIKGGRDPDEDASQIVNAIGRNTEVCFMM